MRLTLEEFRRQFSQVISAQATQQERIESCLALLYVFVHRLPLFYENNYIQDVTFDNQLKPYNIEYKCKDMYFADYKTISHKLKEEWINPQLAIGVTWLYKNEIARSDVFLQRFANILVASPEKLPPVTAYKANDFFICNDGNRRIYAAYLLGRDVKIEYNSEYKTFYNINLDVIEQN